MNNQNFVYPVLDSNFPLGVLEEQNKSSVYEGSGVSSDVTFRTPSYPLSCENFVSDVNSTLGKELNGHMSSSHHQAVGNDSSVIVTTKPQPLGSAFNNMNLCKSDSLIYSTSNSEASVISAENQFCSSYPSPIPSGDPAVPFSNSIQPAQIEQFVSNTSDPNEFSLQFGPTNFTNHATVFANSPTSYNHRADNNVQPPLIQDMSEFNVELIDGNQIPKACPQVNATSESSVYCGQSVQLSASYTEIPLQSQGEFPDANLSAYPVYSDTSTTQEEKLDIEYNSTSSLSSECIAEASSHSCNTISQTSAEAIVNASSGEALNDSHNNNMQGEKIVASGICDANIQKNPKTSDENFRSSLSAEGNEDNSMNSENIFQPSNYQVSLDGLPNAFETFEDGTLSVGVQEKEMASGSNEQEKEAIDEAALHDESPKNQNSEDQIPCNTSCSDKRFNADVSANEQEALAEEGVKVNHLEGESSNDSPKVEENTEPALIEETISKPMSPMITVLNDVFEEEIKSEKRGKTSEEKPPETDSKNSVRVTRARTGTLPNKTRRFVDEYINDTGDDSSHDGFPNEDWEYEEGAELAPCTVDPSITVSKKVLQVTEAELDFYHRQFSGAGVEGVLKLRPHCTSCGKHIGAAPNCIHLGNRHKVLRVLTCYKCQAFYGLGRFPKDSDGSEMYCRWCGQGGQIICCSNCPNVFCESCIKRNFGPSELNTITNSSDWSCYMCNYEELWRHRAVCWALLTYTMQKKKEALNSNDPKILSQLEEDRSRCCGTLKPKKRKHTNRPKHTSANAANAPQTPHLSEAVAYPGNAHYGHFLFDSSSAVETQDDDDDFIDPSQFVQPVLQEERAQPRQQSVLSMNQQRPVIQQKVSAQTETFHSIAPRPVGSRFSISNQQSRAITSISSAGPRIVIRQGNLMQPGLVPINSQPNSIRMPGRVIVRNAVTSVSPATPPRPTTRNPANVLNNMDGVRSMDQLLSLNQVPWFRDGIDNIRAVGFALTKRIRELEARFHSLKNKQDVEKVVKLGKKLDRLSRKTELRFKKINSDIEVASKKWFLQKVGCGGRDQAHPFNRYTDSLSDWDDDMELSRPLEKVMIPINTAAIQSTGGRALVNSSIPPPLVSTGSAPALRVIPQAPRSALSRRIPTTTTVPSHKNQQLQVRTVFTNNHLSVQQVRIPGPKSSVARYRQVPRINTPSLLRPSNVDGVNTFLNQRNGTHNISVSLISSTKRRRQESESSDSSDVVVCPTIPELLDKHNIRPCKVRVEKCDEFIVSFLENQEKVRLHNVFSASDRAITSCTDVSGDAECLQEVDTVLVPCDVCITDTSTSTFEPTDKPCNASVEQDVLKVSRNEENILLNPKKNMKDSENLQEVESVFVPCDISINDSSSSFFEPTSMPCNLSVEDGVSESFRNEENIVITQEGLPIQNKVINVLDKKDQLNVSRNLQVSRNNLGNMTDSIDTGAHDDDDDDENDIEIINEVNQSSISYRSFSPKTI